MKALDSCPNTVWAGLIVAEYLLLGPLQHMIISQELLEQDKQKEKEKLMEGKSFTTKVHTFYIENSLSLFFQSLLSALRNKMINAPN